MQTDDRTPQQRAGLLVWSLAHGEALTTAQAARLTGLTHGSAWKLLSSLSVVVPLRVEGGKWMVVAFREGD